MTTPRTNVLDAVLLSMASGAIFALGMAFASGLPAALWHYAALVGGIVGFVLSPGATFARSDSQCRVSFAWVFCPTFAVAIAAGRTTEPFAALLLTIVTYSGTAAVAGLWQCTG
ncbi:MAG TPA: hypothetical protein VFF69_10940 [Phycisphaerales bacterium]|nr:hypothetical protein [Phycisphaerales bacterium]